ncbi:MAG: hypothetical protein C0507_08485 [Cyanobacteria bacterium PR.3.49]|nr:hypothetical protein [Cyanobacteria bacterium PR.3.49]
MLKTGVIVLDTNVLLDFYKFTPKTRKIFLSILEALKERLWIPHQIGKEYQKNRHKRIDDQLRSHKNLVSALKAWMNSLDNFKQHPFVDREKLLPEIKKASDEVLSILEKSTKELLGKEPQHGYPEICEELHMQLTKLYEGKVGPSYEQEKQQEKLKLALERYARKIPPGYKDANAQEEARAGDGILWFQLLDQASSEKEAKPYLFVTGEEKPDWWFKNENKELIAPRKELIEEMQFTANTEFWLMHTKDFIPLAEKVLGLQLEESVIKEIESLHVEANESNLRGNHDHSEVVYKKDFLHGLYMEIMHQLTSLSGSSVKVSPLTFPIALNAIARKGLIPPEDCQLMQRALGKAVDAMTASDPDLEDLDFYTDWLEYILEKLQSASCS